MDNKKYLDKVLGYMVRGTKMDYENEALIFPFPFHPSDFPSSSPFLIFYHSSSFPLSSFTKYCKNTFGLTEEEIKYVFKQYREIIKDKIEDGQ